MDIVLQKLRFPFEVGFPVY